MKEQPIRTGDKPADWLFSRTGAFPLLNAEQERTIDQSKWQAVRDLEALLLTDPEGRYFLGQWAANLLQRPPALDAFGVREYYNLLKREQASLQQKGDRHAQLQAFSERMAATADEKLDLAAVLALQLPAVLVVGLAEAALKSPEPREMAAALQYWQRSWPHTPGQTRATPAAATSAAIRSALHRYYGARTQLVNHNLRLVYAIAGKLNSKGLPYEDVVQGGMLGLIRAAEKYHHGRGFRFSTYAYNWINQSTRQYIDDMQGIVRYPAGINDKISRLYRERLEYITKYGTEPGTKYLAEQLEVPEESIKTLQQVRNFSVSLDAGAGSDDEGLSLAETLPGHSESASQLAENASLHRCLLNKLSGLTIAERNIVKLRWGLEQSSPLTRAQVADQMGVSTEWVRQLELSALNKLRHDKTLMQVYRDHLSATH